jgi:hypothetical protein
VRALTGSLLLLGLGWIVLVAGLWADARRGSPEPAIRRYLADLEAHRVEAALAALQPEVRERSRDFLEFQQFNRYEVVSIAVRSPSLLAVATAGLPWRATQATLVADIVEPSGVRWRGSTLIDLSYAEGRWYLAKPPFAP